MSKLDTINGKIRQGSPNPANAKDKPKPKDRKIKEVEKKRPFWKRDWKK